MKKKVIIPIALLAALWIAVGVTDYCRVHAFERPLFCLLTEPSYDDGSSGHYQGLGYAFDITGNFMPSDEYPGVTQYSYYLFGREVRSGIRD